MSSQAHLQAVIFGEIADHRVYQDTKWGYPRNELEATDWITILAEEVGEASDEALSVRFSGTHLQRFREELIQAAAVCVAILEHYWDLTDEEASNATAKETG